MILFYVPCSNHTNLKKSLQTKYTLSGCGPSGEILTRKAEGHSCLKPSESCGWSLGTFITTFSAGWRSPEMVVIPLHPKSSSHTWWEGRCLEALTTEPQEMFRDSNTSSNGVWKTRDCKGNPPEMAEAFRFRLIIINHPDGLTCFW